MNRLTGLFWRGVALLEGRRALVAFTIAFAAVSAVTGALSASGDFLGAQPGWLGLFIFSVLTGLLGTVTAVGISSAGGPRPMRLDQRQARAKLAKALAPRTAPPAFTQFTGRQETLDDWLEEYQRLRKIRNNRQEDQGPVGPMVLAIHGPAGVGKSALAWELARRLLHTGHFEGLLVATFGAAATTRGAADISRDLLRQLGWPDKDMPMDAADRANTLRSRTRNEKLLFVFDAVRDHDQVRSVMPAGSRCTVILVSRREIGSLLGIPPRSPLARPTTQSAVEILNSLSGVDWTRAPETAVEVVNLCGRLPLAIRAAAELARDHGDIRHVAHLLRPETRRLETLDYGGRNISHRLESELDRLPSTLREAITHLSNLDSRSFVPWVLRPLLNLPPHESTTIARELEKLQLIERIDDDATGQPRYRVDPLARLYARAHPRGDVTAARARLDLAYLDLVDDVLALRGDGYALIRQGERQWRSDQSTIADKANRVMDRIVRQEYLNLVRVIEVAPFDPYAPLIWRVAALLDGRLPALPEDGEDRVRRAFDRAVRAAQTAPEPLAPVDVHFWLAQFLIAIEHYDEAFGVLDGAMAALPASTAPATEIASRQLRAARIRAWAYVQTDNFRAARAVLETARPMFAAVPREHRDQRYLTDVELLKAFGREAGQDVDSAQSAVSHTDNDIATFLAVVAHAGQHRRARRWVAARRTLSTVLRRDGDARGRATVLYQMARAYLDEAYELITGNDHHQAVARARDAARFAAECAHTYNTITNEVGQIRARCLVHRALALTGNGGGTRIRVRILESDLERYRSDSKKVANPETHPAYRPLRARLERAHGEVEVALSGPQSEAALSHLTEAARLFRELEDTANYDEVLRVLGSAGE